MSKFCSNCGEKVDDNIAFCPECGQKFDVNVQPEQPMQYEQDYQATQYSQPVQNNQPIQPMQNIPNQPINYQNGYNPYGQQPNNYNPYNNQQNGYNGNNFQASGTVYANIAESLKWTTYTGRLNRQRYFLRGLGISFGAFLISFIFAFIAAILGAAEDTATAVGYLFALPLIVLSYFNSMKRAHDLDKTGWIVLVSFIPFVNIIFGLYLLFAKGTDGPNKYGDDPLMY